MDGEKAETSRLAKRRHDRQQEGADVLTGKAIATQRLECAAWHADSRALNPPGLIGGHEAVAVAADGSKRYERLYGETLEDKSEADATPHAEYGALYDELGMEPDPSLAEEAALRRRAERFLLAQGDKEAAQSVLGVKEEAPPSLRAEQRIMLEEHRRGELQKQHELGLQKERELEIQRADKADREAARSPERNRRHEADLQTNNELQLAKRHAVRLQQSVSRGKPGPMEEVRVGVRREQAASRIQAGVVGRGERR